MDSEMDFFNMEQLSIPEEFKDSTSGKQFEKCKVCETSLQNPYIIYFIEKAIRKNIITGKNDVIFEYAICYNCAMNLSSGYSKQSQENLMQYFSAIDFNNRNKNLHQILKEKKPLDKLFSNCIVKGTSKENLEEYQLIGLFQGSHIMPTFAPFMLGGEATDEMMNLLSDQTLGEIDDFIGEHFTGPPGFSEFLKKPRHVILV